MLIEILIEELQKIPKGTNVCLYDYRKNLGDDIGDGSSAGIYDDFEIAMHTLEPDEEEFFKEQNDFEFIPWLAFGFKNDDYNDDGQQIDSNMLNKEELEVELMNQAKRMNLDFTKPSDFALGWRKCAEFIAENMQVNPIEEL